MKVSSSFEEMKFGSNKKELSINKWKWWRWWCM